MNWHWATLVVSHSAKPMFGESDAVVTSPSAYFFNTLDVANTPEGPTSDCL